jgi:hypothetical protein
MRRLSAQRRRVVALSGSVAAMGGLEPLLRPEHPHLVILLLCFMVCMLGLVIAQLVKLKKEERGAPCG